MLASSRYNASSWAVEKLCKSVRTAEKWKDPKRIVEFECNLLGLFMINESNFGICQRGPAPEPDQTRNDDADCQILPEDEELDFNFCDSDADNEDDDDPDYEYESDDGDDDTHAQRAGVYNMTPLRWTAEVAARLGVGNEALAKILSCHHRDLGTGTIVTEKKVRCQKTIVFDEAIEKRKGMDAPGLYSDSKLDRGTLGKSAAGGVTKTTEDHHSVVVHYPEQTVEEKQEGTYMGFFVPKNGTGVEIAVGLKTYCEFMRMNTDVTQVMGADGTATNTGKENGAIVHFERILKRPLFWAICSIHRVELPLRHLIEKKDGKTTGPEQYIGPIGKLLAGELWMLPVADFDPIVAEDFPVISEAVFQTFSTDVKYLYLLCISVINGDLPVALHKQKMGPLCHSRWFTTASRVLRLYVSCTCDLPWLPRFANYVINVYFKTYLEIKKKNSISYGANHLLLELTNVQTHCSEEEKEVLFPVLQNNCFYAHPEAIFLSMLADPRKIIRERAIKLLTEVRGQDMDTGRRVRKFEKPALQTSASEVWNLCKMKKKKRLGGRLCYLTEAHKWKFVHEPPVTKGRDLQQWSDKPLVFHFPCHSQTVELAVLTTSNSVDSSIHYLSQLGNAFATIDSRKSVKGRVARKRKCDFQ